VIITLTMQILAIKTLWKNECDRMALFGVEWRVLWWNIFHHNILN